MVFQTAGFPEAPFNAAALDIELLFLPAYSPNLSLIERLWKLAKKRTLTNRYYDCFDKFRLANDACLENLNGPAKSELDSLLLPQLPVHDAREYI